MASQGTIVILPYQQFQEDRDNLSSFLPSNLDKSYWIDAKAKLCSLASRLPSPDLFCGNILLL